MTRHFSQFLFAPYGEGEGLRAVDPVVTEVRPDVSDASRGSAVLESAVLDCAVLDCAVLDCAVLDCAAVEGAAVDCAATDAELEARAEAEAHAARAALLAQVYGWPHRTV